MGSKVWNYILGYVIINITGRSLERLVNQCVAEGIRIWNIKRTKPNALSAYLMCEDFYKLKPILKKNRCKVHILSKHGAPFLYTNNRTRVALLFGLIFLMAALFTASRFIWQIDIAGCVTIEPHEILYLLSEANIEKGKPKSTVSTFKVGDELRKRDSRIAWAGATFEGIRLVVKVVEANELHGSDDVQQPASVYATCDGVITKIVAMNGKPMVTIGQAVKTGDVLIEGTLINEGDKKLLVHAYGSVLARVLSREQFEFMPETDFIARSGNKHPSTKVNLFGFTLASGSDYAKSETEWHSIRELSGMFLPIVFEFGYDYELSDLTVQLPDDEAKAKAVEIATERMLSKTSKDATIVTKLTETEVKSDGTIVVTITLVLEKEIGIIKPIQSQEDAQGAE